MALLYDKVVSTVCKEPDERTDTEIEHILPWFRKKSELFKSQKSEIVRDILKNCQFMTCKRDFVVIKQGDKGDCFFIVLSGSVAIHIQTNLGEESIQYDQNTDEEEEEREFEGKKKKELDRSLFGNFVGKIQAGKSFGELALINADCVRNASIIADEVTDLIVVNRDLYNRSLKAFQEKEFNEKKRFVEQYPLFKGWQHRYKKQMWMSLRKEKITFDGIVTKQGLPLDGLCFLVSGQAKMVADPCQHEMQYPDRFPLPDIEELEKVEARESIRREMNMAIPRGEEKKLSYRPRSPNVSERKRAHKNVEVCVIGAVEIIGDLEMTFNLPSYAETALCTQEAEVYILDQKNYERLIEKRNPQALDMMREALHDKLKLRLSWVQEDELPLFNYFLYKLDERKRNEINKYKEYNRRRDIRDNVDYWKSGKLQNGPLIDQYGPGSVFYTIRMRSLSKGLREKNKTGALGFGITRHFALGKHTSVGHLSRKPDFRSAVTMYGRNDANHESNGYNDENDENEGFDDEDEEDIDAYMDATDSPKLLKRSKVLCDHGNSDGSESRSTNSRGSKGQKSLKSVKSGCSVDEFMDKQLNELTLSKLESRIEQWHSKIEDGKNAKKHLVKLHRYIAEDHQKPLPGKKVMCTKKIRRNPNLISLRLEQMEANNREISPSVSLADLSPGMARDASSSRDPAREPARDVWLDPDRVNEESGVRRCWSKRPQSCKPSGRHSNTISIRQRPKSARMYTLEDYAALKEELHRKQITYKSMLTRTDTCYI